MSGFDPFETACLVTGTLVAAAGIVLMQLLWIAIGATIVVMVVSD